MNRCPHCQAKISVRALLRLRFGRYKCPYCQQFAELSITGWIWFILTLIALLSMSLADWLVNKLDIQNWQLAFFIKISGEIFVAFTTGFLAAIVAYLFLIKPKAL